MYFIKSRRSNVLYIIVLASDLGLQFAWDIWSFCEADFSLEITFLSLIYLGRYISVVCFVPGDL